MFKTRSLLLATVLMTSAFQSQGQYYEQESKYFSLGLGFGITDFWGDVGTSKMADHYGNEVYWSNLHAMINVYGRYQFHQAVALRLGLGYGTIYATDEYNKRLANKNPNRQSNGDYTLDYYLYARNQDTKSRIFDANLTLQIMPFKLPIRERYWKLQPFLQGGVGFFHFNPQSTYKNPATGQKEWVDVKDLHLEGEGLNYPGAPAGYSLNQICIPMGFGLQYNLSHRVDLSFEYMYRYTFTDYLDGVSNQKYVDPAIFDQVLSAEDAAKAKVMYNKTPELDLRIDHAPVRGSTYEKDGYSTWSFTFGYKLYEGETKMRVRGRW